MAVLAAQGLISDNESSQFKQYTLSSSDELALEELVVLFNQTHCLSKVHARLRLLVAEA